MSGRRHIGLGNGIYFVTAIALATLLLILVNIITVKCDLMLSVPGAHSQLSPRTRTLLETVSGSITCTVVIPHNDRIYIPLRSLLLDIRDAVADHASLSVDFVDPHSNLGRSADAAKRYGLNGLAVVFDNGTQVERVPYDALIEIENSQLGQAASSTVPKHVRFMGEQVCATSLVRLAKPKSPLIYALTGHGERDFASYDSLTGYSDFAREIAREGYQLRSLRIDDAGIPDDCDLLIVAGPRHMPVAAENAAIDSYLKHGGRIMLLLDRSNVIPNGWEEMIESVGLTFAGVTAVDAGSLGGFNLPIDHFGDHPITRDITQSADYFTDPQVIDIRSDISDSLTANVIAKAPPSAWGESNPETLPRNYDPQIDRKGDLPIAFAVEAKGGETLGIKPMRAVVFGDSSFAANSLLAGGSNANRDLLLNAVSWLTDSGLASASSLPTEGSALRLSISRGKLIRFWSRSVFIVPLCVVVFGAIMAYLRRFTR